MIEYSKIKHENAKIRKLQQYPITGTSVKNEKQIAYIKKYSKFTEYKTIE